jgi:hypothetical protein
MAVFPKYKGIIKAELGARKRVDAESGKGELGTRLDAPSWYVWATIHYLDSPTDYREFTHMSGGMPPTLATFTVESVTPNKSSWIYFVVGAFSCLGFIALIVLTSMCF